MRTSVKVADAMGKVIEESPYTEKVTLVRSMASWRYGQEVIERPSHKEEPSDKMTWRFRNVTSGPYIDDPLFWRLDTYEKGVNAHAIFQLYDEVTEELVEQKFLAMEVSREEFYENNQKPEGEESGT